MKQMSWRVVLFALAVPVLAVALASWLTTARGPFFLGSNSEPSYIYLLNGLGILEGHSPNHTDHPGTPLQAVIAVIVAATYALSGTGGMVRSVLTEPERYLNVIQFVFGAGCIAALFATGVAVYRSTRSLVCVAFMQLAPFFSVQAALAFLWVKPESWLLCLGLAQSCMLLHLALNPKSLDSDKTARWLGVLTGVGLAVKATFLPMVFIPLIVLKSWRLRLLSAKWAAVALLISLLPILPRARQVARWFVLLTIRKGTYGTGEYGLVESSSLLPALKTLVALEPVFFGLLAVTWLIWLVLRSRTSLHADPRFGGAMRIMLAICVAATTQILFTLKRPQAHYMFPAMMLVGAQALIAGRLFTRALQENTTHPARLLAWRVAVPVLLITLCGLLWGGSETARWQRELTVQRDSSLPLAQKIAPACAEGSVVCCFRCSLPVYALNLGNDFCGKFFSPQLAEVYPREVFYNVWTKTFHTFGAVLTEQDIVKLAAERPLYFAGSPWEINPPDAKPQKLSFELNASGGVGEVLYLARPAP
ncbi:MAG TPA: hypothetical protein VGP72_17315 [Planctomycetota bacterium]|jgi:hypothetical protein